MNRAKTYEEIEPLVRFCRLGKLFEVQEWISSGKPVNLPGDLDRRVKLRYPLYIAIESGFHSLVRVLLEGGTFLNDLGYSPLEHAVYRRRPDLVQLLVAHGADIHSVSMRTVFDHWEPEMVELFINNGADVETDNPLAHALCSKMRPALGLFKRYKDRFPSFEEQLNIALRHHCWEGNIKWVSLTLWAGADPYSKGPQSPDHRPSPEEDSSALELAAFLGQVEVFKFKQIRLDPTKPGADLLLNACYSKKADFVKKLLENGFTPRSMEDGGSSLIHTLLSRLPRFHHHLDAFYREENIDDSESRERIKMIHLLARYGAKWRPSGGREINEARRSLLKMKPDYTVEFLWIMSGYKASTRDVLQELMRPKPIRMLVAKHETRVKELMETFRQ